MAVILGKPVFADCRIDSLTRGFAVMFHGLDVVLAPEAKLPRSL